MLTSLDTNLPLGRSWERSSATLRPLDSYSAPDGPRAVNSARQRPDSSITEGRSAARGPILDLYQVTGRIEGGEFSYDDDGPSYHAALESLEGADVILTLERASAARIRNTQQNRLMWRVFAVIAEASGYDKNDVHDLMCEMFLSRPLEVVDPNTGESTEHTVVMGTSRLKVKPFAEFLHKVMLWAQEMYGCEFQQ